MDSSGNLPRVRASDSDRDAAVTRLRDALSHGQLSLGEFDERTKLAYSSTFREELAQLVNDLPEVSGSGPVTSAPATVFRRVTGERGGSPVSFGILGATEYGGDWLIAPRHFSLGLLGATELDLSGARLSADTTSIYALGLVGAVGITVSEDVRVVREGIGLLGRSE